MATESVTNSTDNIAESEQAITECFLDAGWHESKLPAGVAGRLLRVDRALHGASCIANMLHEDSLGKADKEANGVQFEGMAHCRVESLGIAMTELLATALAKIEEVRENHRNCVGTAPRPQTIKSH